MPRFFIPAGDRPPADGGQVWITGPDAVHIRRSLRMREGETLFLCDGEGTDYFCELAGFEGEGVLFRVLYHTPTALEPDTAVTLYQGLPKGEKMDWILQKAVELGAGEIVPVVTARSIVRLKPGEGEKKRERWQRIAAEAAGQCGRGRIPLVSRPLPFAEAAARLAGEPALVFYEGGGRPLVRWSDGTAAASPSWLGRREALKKKRSHGCSGTGRKPPPSANASCAARRLLWPPCRSSCI